MSQFPPYQPTGAPGVKPHRGVMILVFGILGVVCCFIFGIIAWVMGNSDLQAMAEGRMDRDGEGLTKAGKILGIVSVCLLIVGVVIQVLAMVLGLGFSLIPMQNP
jgi:hypothetical protein